MEKKLELENAILVSDGKGHKQIKPKLDPPDTLFKYYFLNENSVSSIVNGTIHLSHSCLLNDIMDGNFALTSDFYSFYENRSALKEIYPKYIDFFQNFIPELYSKVVNDLGIFSMCETFDNDLLWSHYTSEQGFCIEFKTDLLFNSLAYENKFLIPVSYDLNKIEFDKYIYEEKLGNVEAWIPFLHSMVSKESCWNYEKEWRILIGKNYNSPFSDKMNLINSDLRKQDYENLVNRNIQYNLESVDKIIFATCFFSSDRFKSLEINSNVLQYFFLKPEDKKLYLFLNHLQKHFSDRVFQVNKNYNAENGKFERGLHFRIEIVEVDENFVNIKRIRI